ncbi:MAG: calcium/sodium antiporter [Lachnospiraceae bacterium]|nr:calcium/sodium antiporter [Lachnospiraceae bacterium]
MNYILLVIGFVLLIKGADYFVEGASIIAEKFKIPPLIIGLTIVAFGTSAPEAAVSITSSLKGSNDIAIGNAVGSNIFNLLLVVGIAALICPLHVKKSIILKEFPFCILSAFVLMILSQDIMFQGIGSNYLSRADGFMLIVLFGIYVYYLIELAVTGRSDESNESENVSDTKLKNGFLITLAVVGGMAAIVGGGQLVVNAASNIAISWGMSESLVGLTIVAIGTSLPELVTSIIAARKGKSDIALGNVIGSNIFNVFLVLGLSALICNMAVSAAVLFDMVLLLIFSILAYIFSITKKQIGRIEGGILSALYIAYMVFIIIRS